MALRLRDDRPNPVKHTMEHLCRQASRIRVVSGAMITIENIWPVFERMELVMAEFKRRFAMTKHVEC